MKTTVLLVIVGCAFATALPQKYANDVDVTIINGKEAARGQFPYMVSLQSYGMHFCGASIVAQSWLVSAAHCFYEPLDKVVAVAGLLVQKEKGQGIQYIPVARSVLHPSYDANTQANDLALVQLKSPLSYNDFVKPVGLPTPNVTPTGKAVVSGWGVTSINPEVDPTNLQYLETNILSNSECNKILETVPLPTLESNQICTVANEAHQSACVGDSGGPLVQNNVLVGIVSWGDESCTQKLPTPGPNVFTNVAGLVDFISQTIKS